MRSSIVASAVALVPRRFVLEPHSAYDSVCGSDADCGGGFTAFCCTINHQGNFCPEGSFVGGWWKADRSAFCRGAARYYIDCNGDRGSDWHCHCSDSATCDKRHVACAQFRYGNCSLDVPEGAWESPVVCRVVTCTPPWKWDESCTTTTMVDDLAASHSAPCLPGPWPSPIVMKWSDLGGPGGPLGPMATPVSRLPHDEGHYATFRKAAIYDVAWLGIVVVGPEVWPRFRGLIGPHRAGYPLTDQRPLAEKGTWFQEFGRRGAHGRIVSEAAVYSRPEFGPHFIAQPVLSKWHSLGGERGSLGFPTSNTGRTADGTSKWATFARIEHRRIVSRAAIYANPVVGTWSVRDAILHKWRLLHSEAGVLGYPLTDERHGPDGVSTFNLFGVVRGDVVTSRGAIYSTAEFGTRAVSGLVFSKWDQLGAARGALGYPTQDEAVTPDGRGVMGRFSPLAGSTSTTGGGVVSSGVGTWALIGSMCTAWLVDDEGTVNLGLPTADEMVTDVSGTPVRSQEFETGSIYDSALGASCILYGPIRQSWLGKGGLASSLGIPLSSVVDLGGGVQQVTFQGGSLTYTPGIGVQ